MNVRLNQVKTNACEFAAIFENAFDQFNIIYQSLSINDFNKNSNHYEIADINLNNINPYSSISQNSNCRPFTMHEQDKLRYELEYFFHIFTLLFRATVLGSPTEFLTSINSINNNLLSIQLIELNNRYKKSHDKINKLSNMKSYFHTEKSQELNALTSMKSQLKGRLMEENYRSKVLSCYCNDWKRYHISQWIEMLHEIEQNYTKSMNDNENILEQIGIAHKETIKILTKQTDEMKLNANKCYEYYRNKTNDFVKELTNLRQELYHVKRQRQHSCEEYHRMKIIVDEYNQLKMNENLLLEKRKQQKEAIQRIQTWWRGTMARRVKRKRRKKRQNDVL
ncbi:unnamed protein product [Rotaria socialis]|uniref:Dynein regulatory complex protein 9 n=2 Tax=Rotaria socialis TaxID=392032 RepID=A0A821I8E6_9BILA|nr:unnamed protein product [Rotaria socialis]CAF4695498.1 unnamed protein product [Rotaria socialis]